METERFFADLASRLADARQADRRKYEWLFHELAPRLNIARKLDFELDRHLARRFNVFDYLRQDYPTLRYFRELRPVSRDFGKPTSDRSVREALGALPLDPVCPPLYRRAGWRRGCGSAWSGHGWKDFLARTGTVAAITDMRSEHQGLGRESRSSPVLAASVCAGVWMGARAARGGPGPGVAGARRRAGPGVRARAGP